MVTVFTNNADCLGGKKLSNLSLELRQSKSLHARCDEPGHEVYVATMLEIGQSLSDEERKRMDAAFQLPLQPRFYTSHGSKSSMEALLSDDERPHSNALIPSSNICSIGWDTPATQNRRVDYDVNVVEFVDPGYEVSSEPTSPRSPSCPDVPKCGVGSQSFSLMVAETRANKPRPVVFQRGGCDSLSSTGFQISPLGSSQALSSSSK